jgi:hypothetical protein
VRRGRRRYRRLIKVNTSQLWLGAVHSRGLIPEVDTGGGRTQLQPRSLDWAPDETRAPEPAFVDRTAAGASTPTRPPRRRLPEAQQPPADHRSARPHLPAITQTALAAALARPIRRARASPEASERPLTAPTSPSPPTSDARFIVCSGRCSSTLLSEIVGDHRSIASISELFSAVRPIAFPSGTLSGDAFWRLLSPPRQDWTAVLQEHGEPPEFRYRFDPAKARLPGVAACRHF